MTGKLTNYTDGIEMSLLTSQMFVDMLIAPFDDAMSKTINFQFRTG